MKAWPSVGVDFRNSIVAGKLVRYTAQAFQQRGPVPKLYGRLAPLFGHRLTPDLIDNQWPDIQRVIGAMACRTVTPSLILKKLSAYWQQNSLAAALREAGRIERTLFTLRWFQDRRCANSSLANSTRAKRATV